MNPEYRGKRFTFQLMNANAEHIAILKHYIQVDHKKQDNTVEKLIGNICVCQGITQHGAPYLEGFVRFNQNKRKSQIQPILQDAFWFQNLFSDDEELEYCMQRGGFVLKHGIFVKGNHARTHTSHHPTPMWINQHKQLEESYSNASPYVSIRPKLPPPDDPIMITAQLFGVLVMFVNSIESHNAVATYAHRKSAIDGVSKYFAAYTNVYRSHGPLPVPQNNNAILTALLTRGHGPLPPAPPQNNTISTLLNRESSRDNNTPPLMIAQQPDSPPPYSAQQPHSPPPYSAQQPNSPPPYSAQQPDSPPPPDSPYTDNTLDYSPPPPDNTPPRAHMAPNSQEAMNLDDLDDVLDLSMK